MLYWLIPLLVIAILALVIVIWSPLRSFGKEMQIERARELFKLQRERLEAQFLKAAAATGKPRGLRWKDCQWDDAVEFVRERSSGQIAARMEVTVQFETIERSNKEGLPTVVKLGDG